MSDIMNRKLMTVLVEAIRHLDPDDYAERCKQPPGIMTYVEGEAVRYTWGGKDLAIVERRWLTDDSILEIPDVQFLPTADDGIPDDIGEIGWGVQELDEDL
ncbi:hypothetical protein [Rhodococcus sp. 311R]|uniref:hypothetical protein n=1 Tax=Rhodococcus sp. 311R TaxID=1617904 RepID=UPI00067F1D86|nr:hypothetical protein [Rhodococcus sp. 311R]